MDQQISGPSCLLLIEDNEGDAVLARESLLASLTQPFEMLHVTTLREGLGLLETKPIDLVILDLDLPDSNGIDTLHTLKRHFPTVPVLILSGHIDEELRSSAYAEGVRDFIGKNDPPAVLLARSVMCAMEQHRAMEGQRQILRLVSLNPDGVIVVDEDGVVQFVNDAALTLFGRTREEFVGELMGFSIHEGKGTEINILRNGEKIIAEMHIVHVLWDGKKSYLASIRDVTEQKRLSDQLRQAQKMEAIGRLAGGVAHDFNNLLTVINGCADILMMQLNLRSELMDLLGEIAKAGHRAADLTGQLLAFSRKSIIKLQTVNLNDVLAGLQRMLQRLIGEDIILMVRLSDTPPLIDGDPSQIEQVIMNLIVNARDAMPTGGYLTISSEVVSFAEKVGAIHQELPPGHYAKISITDTGTGMNDETQLRIFEPFFTTKGMGRGTGLGLAMVYGIVNQCGGHIEVSSQINEGTTFEIYFPLVTASDSRQLEVQPTSLIDTPTGEIILLVEDDAAVQRYTRRVLEAAGYQVLATSSGQAALEMASKCEERIALLLSDVVMPHMSGSELCDRLKEVRPDIRVLLMSGYTDEAIVLHGVHTSKINFINKPFNANDLKRMIREILDGPAE